MAERRYFPATLMAGRVYRDTMVYRTEAQVDMTFNPHTGERKIHSVEELEDAMRISRARPLPTIDGWISQDLEGEARRSVAA